jgi:hypothetical protein
MAGVRRQRHSMKILLSILPLILLLSCTVHNKPAYKEKELIFSYTLASGGPMEIKYETVVVYNTGFSKGRIYSQEHSECLSESDRSKLISIIHDHQFLTLLYAESRGFEKEALHIHLTLNINGHYMECMFYPDSIGNDLKYQFSKIEDIIEATYGHRYQRIRKYGV